jgi:hypothetical protein
MISATFDSNKFQQDMKNIVKYSEGFIEGAKLGKRALLQNIGREVVEALKEFIDSNARLSPDTLHHVYEWYQTGSPESRLFEIQYVATGIGLSFNSTFRQSTSVKSGSKVPFYDKARIMEDGVPVTIRPILAKALAFEGKDGMVFTKGPIQVSKPGGASVQGSYSKVFDQFFNQYFTQSFLRSSGVLDHLDNPQMFKKHLNRGKQVGRSAGISVGYRWIAKTEARNV